MIEFLCTLAGIIAGGAIVASIMTIREQGVHEDFQHQLDNLNTEKIRGISTQLHSLSERVLDNVCSHSVKIKHFGDELTTSTDVDADKILEAVDKIISANQQMQNELESAQRQLAEQQEIIEQTTIQAKSDSLTGLANRRGVDDYLGELLRTKPSQDLVGLLLMDIDHFKRFNDTYGHLTGDAVLTCFARTLTQLSSKKGFPARYGGEEFVVVLSGSTEQEIVEQAAYIRKKLSEQVISHEDLELTITASAGLCTVRPGDNLTIAYERSDVGLYKAKEAGRNRGLWLDKEEWKSFPEPKFIGPEEAAPNASQPEDAAPEPSRQTAAVEPSDELEPKAVGPVPPATESGEVPETTNTLHDLATFVEKVKEHLQQLQQMDLPSAAIMLEAVIVGEEAQHKESWQKIVDLIQSKIRDVDVICHFRPSTVCIFLPGCSAEASYERASDLKKVLIAAAMNWESPAIPERFAVAVGHVLEKEEAPKLLDRMEESLNEAHKANEQEIAIHDGTSTQFLEL